MKKSFFLVIVAFSLFLFTGCRNKPLDAQTCALTWWVACWIADHSDLSGSIDTVLLALKNQDFATLAQFVWPQGLRFSPYEHVSTGTDIVLSTDEVANALTISRSYIRWAYDGSGEPIDLWIWQYFEKFVNDADYATAPEVYQNQSIQRGNTINNIAEVYSGKQWVEFYFSGFDAQYQWMDRKSLTLVFEQVNNEWYLIGIIHGQRTI